MDSSYSDHQDHQPMQIERTSRFLEKRTYPHPQGSGICSNKNCAYQKDNLPVEIVSLDASEREYCINCATSIKDKWVCPYCNEIGCKEDSSPEHSDWVQCCMKICKRWVHQDCEKTRGFKDIKTLVLDKKYKYICLSCRSKKPVKKYREVTHEVKKSDKFISKEEYRRSMVTKRKSGQMNYIYLHSETYQSIEKLLSMFDKGSSSLMLNESELREDFLQFNEVLGSNVFEVPGNSTIKAGGSKMETVSKQPVKKIGKKIGKA